MMRTWKKTFTDVRGVEPARRLRRPGHDRPTAPTTTAASCRTTTARKTPSAAYEAPETLVPGASRRLASNIVGADVGKTFGTDDAHVPYPDTYWPFTDDGIDATWNGGDSAAREAA